MSEMQAMEIEILALSKQGGRHYNEDTYGHWQDDNYIACIVADGAGGHGGGDVAADIALQTVLGGFSAQPSMDAQSLRDYLVHANSAVVARQADGGKLATMRTTLVLAVIDLQQKQLMCAHCGDSRAYLFRDGKVILRTADHSLVQQMVSSGMIDDEGARLHPQRNLLLSALGGTEEELEITVSAPMSIEPGDVLLLCSDGVWEPLGDNVFEQTLDGAPSPRSWLRSIDDFVQSHAKPGHDNYTALTLWAYADEQVTQISDLPP
jgi:PPM family protein phosphatase